MKNRTHKQEIIQEGFSRLSDDEKARIISQYVDSPEIFLNDIELHRHSDTEVQERYGNFSENTLTNYFLPYGIAPNFLINGKIYQVPMVIEESSVVAAAASAAKFWLTRGGFHSRVLNFKKTGQVHFLWKGLPEKLLAFFNDVQPVLQQKLEPILTNMKKRGGGIVSMDMSYLPDVLENYYQMNVVFDTVDSMGANFINSVLEETGKVFQELIASHSSFSDEGKKMDVIMAILSNYTPECTVECRVETSVKQLDDGVKGWSGEKFAERFIVAVTLADKNIYRAVTHNKGILNGVDSIVLATGNDFRAVEANIHAFASRNGKYSSLSKTKVGNGIFSFQLEIPLALGTVGGLTSLHPMAEHSLELLGRPSAEELMEITAAVGLANHFSALRSLISTGIQSGHMKLHLNNIMAQLKTTGKESEEIRNYFKGKIVSYYKVNCYLQQLRKTHHEPGI